MIGTLGCFVRTDWERISRDSFGCCATNTAGRHTDIDAEDQPEGEPQNGQ